MICLKRPLLILFFASMGSTFPVVEGRAGAVTYFERVAVEEHDSTEVDVRRPPPEWLDAYLENPDYRYEVETAQAVTWWEQLKQWFWNTLSRLFRDDGQGDIWRYVFYGLTFLAVIVAIVRYMKMDMRGLFTAKKRGVSQILNVNIEELRQTDFLTLAESAMDEGMLRDAARYYYMHVLKVLDGKEVIAWRPQKTNQDYLRECRLSDVKPSFSRLTYLFDYIWYGDFPVERSQVEEMQVLALKIEKGQG